MEELGYRAEDVLREVSELLKLAKGQAARQLGGIWYADHAQVEFVLRMREKYPDALFIVTGDHAGGLVSPQLLHEAGLLPRQYYNLREIRMPTFAMQHPELRQEMFGSSMGTHMHILPTLMELIAPAGFKYYSLFPSLLEKLDHVVTPYGWQRAKWGTLVAAPPSPGCLPRNCCPQSRCARCHMRRSVLLWWS